MAIQARFGALTGGVQPNAQDEGAVS